MPSFVPYLTLQDYLPSIQGAQLEDQILGELESSISTKTREFSESWAMNKIRGRISDEYDLDLEFRPTLPFSFDKVYGAYDRCTIDFNEYDPEVEYILNSLVIKDGYGYVCLVDNASQEWNESQWQSIGNQYDIYHIPPPYPIFSLNIQQQRGDVISGFYQIGDKVWWNGRIYEALAPTNPVSQQEALNYYHYSSVPYPNVFPNSQNSTYWKDLGAFSVVNEPPALPSPGGDPPVWVLGDNRDPVLVQAVVDLAIFQLHQRISPMNIPKIRIERMQATFEWLDHLSKGIETIDINTLQPDQGNDISWGARPKKINGY